jgi:NAD(P)-dependent dehydrogenase (short-subunit alcohol dehydrogenase family)
MNLENKTIFVSGANRGIGKSIVEALLKQPVAKIYAAARNIEDALEFGDIRVAPVKLDITDLDLIKKSVDEVLEKRGNGAIANVISIVGLASMFSIGGYSASKAALFSATQAMRAELKAKNISVHGIFPGPIDTDMSRNFDMPKTSAQVAAENIVKGIITGQEDIFPDPMSLQLSELWAKDPKGLERQFASM